MLVSICLLLLLLLLLLPNALVGADTSTLVPLMSARNHEALCSMVPELY